MIVLLLFALIAFSQTASASEGNFAEGNRLYGAGQYTEAVAAYEGAAGRGEVNANLYYNLANAYHRVGDRGHAILNYQRALVLEPTHTEAAANLAFVRGRAGVEHSQGSGTLAAVRGALAGPGVNFYCWLAAGAGWLAAAGLLGAIFRRGLRVPGLALVVAGAAVVALCVGVIAWLDGGPKSPGRAVVLADSAPALYSPADNAKTIVRLPVGGEVRVLSEQGAWMYIQLGDGARGWMSADKVARVTPPGG